MLFSPLGSFYIRGRQRQQSRQVNICSTAPINKNDHIKNPNRSKSEARVADHGTKRTVFPGFSFSSAVDSCEQSHSTWALTPTLSDSLKVFILSRIPRGHDLSTFGLATITLCHSCNRSFLPCHSRILPLDGSGHFNPPRKTHPRRQDDWTRVFWLKGRLSRSLLAL